VVGGNGVFLGINPDREALQVLHKVNLKQNPERKLRTQPQEDLTEYLSGVRTQPRLDMVES